MATANLHETLLMYTLRKSDLQSQISKLSSQKMLSTLEQADVQSLHNASKSELRNRFKELYANNPEWQSLYSDYTDVPEYQEELDKLQAQFDEQLRELSNWETQIDNQITTASAEQEEINAYYEAFKNMFSSNIQDDYDFGLN